MPSKETRKALRMELDLDLPSSLDMRGRPYFQSSWVPLLLDRQFDILELHTAVLRQHHDIDPLKYMYIWDLSNSEYYRQNKDPARTGKCGCMNCGHVYFMTKEEYQRPIIGAERMFILGIY
jgi:hypothetical protein